LEVELKNIAGTKGVVARRSAHPSVNPLLVQHDLGRRFLQFPWSMEVFRSNLSRNENIFQNNRSISKMLHFRKDLMRKAAYHFVENVLVPEDGELDEDSPPAMVVSAVRASRIFRCKTRRSEDLQMLSLL
jgi:hypothetical protein